jgi:cytochrome b
MSASPLSNIRVFHLLLAAAAIAAYLTGEEESGVHRLIGYSVATLITLRLLLSLLGVGNFGWRRWMPSFAVMPPGKALRHPAISKLLVLAILATITGTATTGVLMDGGRSLANPSFSFGESENGGEDEAGEDDEGGAAQPGVARDDGGEEEEGGALAEIHELLANLILPLVGLHVLYLLIFRRAMARYMLFWPAKVTRPTLP